MMSLVGMDERVWIFPQHFQSIDMYCSKVNKPLSIGNLGIILEETVLYAERG